MSIHENRTKHIYLFFFTYILVNGNLKSCHLPFYHCDTETLVTSQGFFPPHRLWYSFEAVCRVSAVEGYFTWVAL